MKRVFFGFFLMLFILAAAPPPGWAGPDSGGGQCPQANKYRLQRSFYFSNLKEVVRAPQSAEEVRARFAELASPVKWRRQAAISSLALAGNIDLFQQLLAAGDSDGMATYGANYLRADGNLCIDPQIEEAIILHLHAPRFSQAFLSFFEKNLYASRALFQALTPVDYSENDPDQFGRSVKALCATRLAGLDKQLLAIGTAALAHDTPGRKRVMPGVHQSLVRYFASQRLPVFDYFRAVFAAEPRHEEVTYFQNNYAQTRLILYQALNRYVDEESFLIFLEQLAVLSKQAWGPFFSSELKELLTYLQGHSLFALRKDEVVPLLAQILQSPSLPSLPGYKKPWEPAGEPSFYDQQIRTEVYGLLATIDSETAGGLLQDELARLVQRPAEGYDKALLQSLLRSLASLSGSVSLDVARLVDLAGHFSDQTAQLQLAEVLSRHPQPQGFAFVLRLFAEAFAAPQEVAVSGARLQLEGVLFNLLLQFAEPHFLLQTRDKIDALFMAEELAEERYRQMSKALSELLGEDSPTYLALLASKREKQLEKRRLELAAAHARWRQEMAAELVRQGSRQMIAKNIETLARFGPAAKKAGYWLIRIGQPVLAQAHAALTDPVAPSALKMQLIVVLGEIADISSIPVILEAVESEPDNYELLQDAFLALAKMPQTPETINFASSFLNKDGPDKAKICALAYFASHRDQHALPWVAKFSTPENSSGLRAVALYLAAMLGREEVKSQVVAMLEQQKTRGEQHILLRALAEISSPEEFQEVIEDLGLASDPEVEQVGTYVKFRFSSGEERRELSEKLLIAKTPFYSGQAVEFLLGNGDFAVLEKHLRQQGDHEMSLEMVLYMSAVGQRIFSESRRLGYRLEERDDRIFFQQIN